MILLELVELVLICVTKFVVWVDMTTWNSYNFVAHSVIDIGG